MNQYLNSFIKSSNLVSNASHNFLIIYKEGFTLPFSKRVKLGLSM